MGKELNNQAGTHFKNKELNSSGPLITAQMY